MSETTDFYVSWLGCGAFGVSGIRVKDQEPIVFRPTDISGCIGWMDANDNDAVTYNSLLQVSRWNNKGTLGGYFDASGAGVVSYGVAKQNGLNCVTFENGGFLAGSYSFNFQARSIFLVVRPNSFPSNTAVPIFSSDTTNCQETFFLKNGTWTWFVGKHPSPVPEEAFETATDYTGYASMAEFVIGTDLSDNWTGINGTYISPIYQATASFSTATATYFLGNYFGGSPVNANIDYCEIIIYNKALSGPERIQVEDYLRRKWAIVEPPAPPPPPFVPTDISGLQIWMDANNQSTITTSGTDVLTWSNLGLVSMTFSNDVNYTSYVQDVNSNYVVAIPTGATLATYASLPYYTRTSIAVVENVSDLPTLSYPFENIWSCDAAGGLQLGFAYDSGSTNTYMSMCQNGYNCPVVGAITLPIGGYNLAIWGNDSNNASNNYAYFNGGSNINIGTDLGNLFNTFPIPFGMGSSNTSGPAFRVGEILEYDTLLSTAQLSTIADYLVTKWAISSFTKIS